ncbi:hypothetical protein KI387_043436, partial [Taxus chinensis]
CQGDVLSRSLMRNGMHRTCPRASGSCELRVGIQSDVREHLENNMNACDQNLPKKMNYMDSFANVDGEGGRSMNRENMECHATDSVGNNNIHYPRDGERDIESEQDIRHRNIPTIS